MLECPGDDPVDPAVEGSRHVGDGLAGAQPDLALAQVQRLAPEAPYRQLE